MCVCIHQVLDIVRAAESLALGTHLPGDASGAPPKSPIEHHEDKMHKTTTIVMSAHTLDTHPQVCLVFYFSISYEHIDSLTQNTQNTYLYIILLLQPKQNSNRQKKIYIYIDKFNFGGVN